MDKTETLVNDFKINYLTEEEYQSALSDGSLGENEIYMTPVDDIIKINAKNYGTELPDSGVIGQVFFLLVND